MQVANKVVVRGFRYACWGLQVRLSIIILAVSADDPPESPV